jgi:hypothetical protein
MHGTTAHPLLTVGDLFAAGIGFEICGAVLLALGLIESAEQSARRMVLRGGPSFSGAVAKQAEDRGRAIIGLFALLIGFVVQAVAYFLTLEGDSLTARKPWGSVAALGFALAAAALVGLSAFVLTKPLARSFILELAYYDQEGDRQPLPSAYELYWYGKALGYAGQAGESTPAYARRVFYVSETRD